MVPKFAVTYGQLLLIWWNHLGPQLVYQFHPFTLNPVFQCHRDSAGLCVHLHSWNDVSPLPCWPLSHSTASDLPKFKKLTGSLDFYLPLHFLFREACSESFLRNQMWWCTSIISALKRLRHRGHESEPQTLPWSHDEHLVTLGCTHHCSGQG